MIIDIVQLIYLSIQLTENNNNSSRLSAKNPDP